MTSRCIAVLGATVVAAAGVTACGGSSDQVVARVAGVGSISTATLSHWVPVEAVLLYQEVPTGPVPNGVIPDPPNYTACISYLRSTKQRIGEIGPKPPTAQLKLKCEHNYERLKQITLNTLIGWDWTIGAGKALGMKASDAEVTRRLETVNKTLFPKKGDFAAYLQRTDETLVDMLFRSKVQLFEVKIRERIAALEQSKGLSGQQRQEAIAKLVEGLSPAKQWVARTSCSNGYVVSSCKQYRGPLSPGVPN